MRHMFFAILIIFNHSQVGEITTDLGKHQHMHDRDDLQAEQVCTLNVLICVKFQELRQTCSKHKPLLALQIVVWVCSQLPSRF